MLLHRFFGCMILRVIGGEYRSGKCYMGIYQHFNCNPVHQQEVSMMLLLYIFLVYVVVYCTRSLTTYSEYDAIPEGLSK